MVIEFMIKIIDMLLTFVKTLRRKNMKDYHDMYLKCDVVKLADVVENFRKESINSFELDPAPHLSTPGYSWHTILRFTGVSLKLISDIEKYQFIEIMIRGVISMICKSYGKANIKCLKSYDPIKSLIHINT